MTLKKITPCIKLKFESGLPMIPYIEIAGKRFYHRETSGNLETLHAIANEHPGCEWVIWPRIGIVDDGPPAIYIRNPAREKELEAKARAALSARTG